MRYVGGKARMAKSIVNTIAEYASGATAYYEPFIGAGWVFERAAPMFPQAYGSDIHPDLILMWQAIMDGWEPPLSVSREQYAELKGSPPSALRGFAGFGCSFGSKWFGGYASSEGRDDVCGEAYRSVTRKAAALRGLSVTIQCQSFDTVEPLPGSLIYCDPPYVNTTRYPGVPAFDHDRFWAHAKDWADSGSTVLVSESVAPAGVSCVWERATKGSLSAASNTQPRTERLFRVEPQSVAYAVAA